MTNHHSDINATGTSTKAMRLRQSASRKTRYSNPSFDGMSGIFSPSASMDGMWTQSPAVRTLHFGPAMKTSARVISHPGDDMSTPDGKASALAVNVSMEPNAPAILPKSISGAFMRRTQTLSPSSLSKFSIEYSFNITANKTVDCGGVSMELQRRERGFV